MSTKPKPMITSDSNAGLEVVCITVGVNSFVNLVLQIVQARNTPRR